MGWSNTCEEITLLILEWGAWELREIRLHHINPDWLVWNWQFRCSSFKFYFAKQPSLSAQVWCNLTTRKLSNSLPESLVDCCSAVGFEEKGLLSTCRIWGLAWMRPRKISGFDIKLWVSGESMTCLMKSGLLIMLDWICCCISMKLAEPMPRPERPERPPRFPRPKGVWLASTGRTKRLVMKSRTCGRSSLK